MAEQTRPTTVTIEGARLIFRNFEGRKDKFNLEGNRNFGVVLPTELALQMEADHWNVKWMDPREDGEEPTAWISVKLRFDVRPPRATMVTSKGQVLLNEQTIATLDQVELTNVDLILRAYDWVVNEKPGRTAYLQTIYATIFEDELMKKYSSDPTPVGVDVDYSDYND